LAIIITVVIGVFLVFAVFLAKFLYKKYKNRKIDDIEGESVQLESKENPIATKLLQNVQVQEVIGTGATSEGKNVCCHGYQRFFSV
jgi:regulatory protein YycI of two-component signal transduction system YycFG